MLSFEEIVRKSQLSLKKALRSELHKMGYKTCTKQGFLYAKGDLPIMLVAHLDTVHKESVKTICYSSDGNIVMSPEGIGGDDRAGVYMILQIIKRYRCHVLFCEDEEVGGIGAQEFAGSEIKPEINYIVELDRRGADDAVFYDCDNPEFTEFVTGFGFKEEFGSFSDISVIAPKLGVAAVNISAGYYNEHSRHEYVDLRVVKKNVELVSKMVSTPSEKFEYIEAIRFYRGFRDDFYCCDGYEFETKSLMVLPDSAYVKKPNGDMVECDGEYLIDDAHNIYEYSYELGAAILVNGYEVISGNHTFVRFDADKAIEFDVASMEILIDYYDKFGFGE